MSDRAEELAQAVESIGGEGHKPGVYYHLADDKLHPVPKDAAENLATLEAWLREQLEAGTQAIYWSGEPADCLIGWCCEWYELGQAQISLADADTEAEARSVAAMQAVEAMLKEQP